MKVFKWVLIGIGVLVVGLGVAGYIFFKPLIDQAMLQNATLDSAATLVTTKYVNKGTHYTLLFFSDGRTVAPGGTAILARPGRTSDTLVMSIAPKDATDPSQTSICTAAGTLSVVLIAHIAGKDFPVCEAKSNAHTVYVVSFQDAKGAWHAASMFNAVLADLTPSNPVIKQILESITVD